MQFLLDTNILSEPVKPRPDPRILEKIREHAGAVCTAAPVWNELLFGMYRLQLSKKRSIFERYLREALQPTLVVLPYDSEAADLHAAERARLSISGQTPAYVDGQIAAIAKTRGLIVVTRNVKDFIRFEDLSIEDWSRET